MRTKIKEGICELLDRWEFLRSANVILAKKRAPTEPRLAL